MSGIFDGWGIKMVAAAAVLMVLWIAIGVAPVFIQHRMVEQLITEASAIRELRNAAPGKTYKWLQKEFKQNELRAYDPTKMVKVEGIGSGRIVSYQYEVKRPLVRNVNFVFNFSGQA